MGGQPVIQGSDRPNGKLAGKKHLRAKPTPTQREGASDQPWNQHLRIQMEVPLNTPYPVVIHRKTPRNSILPERQKDRAQNPSRGTQSQKRQRGGASSMTRESPPNRLQDRRGEIRKEEKSQIRRDVQDKDTSTGVLRHEDG